MLLNIGQHADLSNNLSLFYTQKRPREEAFFFQADKQTIRCSTTRIQQDVFPYANE